MSNHWPVARSRWSILLAAFLVASLFSLFVLAAPVDAVAEPHMSGAGGAPQQRAFTMPQLSASQQITATKTDATDGPSAEPGERITYTIRITNSGGSDATAVTVSDVIDLHTTLIDDSLRVTPLAIGDAYDAVGNTPLVITATNGLLANDVDPDDPDPNPPLVDNLTITSFDAASTAGGVVQVQADGSFTYDPPTGFEGEDSFTYSIEDAHGFGDSATVIITVSNMVWYIDNTALSGGDGHLYSPFNTISNTVGAPGDIIFVHESGGGDYSASLTLQDDQQLVGQDFGPSDFATATGLPQTLGAAFPAPGASPTLVSAGDAVTLGNHNAVRGLTIGATTGLGLSGTTFGSLTIRDVSINGSGSILTLNDGAVDAIFDVLSTSGGSTGVSLTDVSGSLSAAGGSIAGVSGVPFALSGGTVAVIYPGSITKASPGEIIEVYDRLAAAGPVTFSGNLSCNAGCQGIIVTGNAGGSITFSGGSKVLNTGTSPGVRLEFNTGATITFSNGGLDIDTTTRIGLSAFGGGTLNVTGSGNTINTLTGIGVSIDNTDIGANDVIFESISVNGALHGIFLVNTGSSGGLIVTGDGAMTNNASGGTIQNTTSFGIRATDTQDLSLTSILIQNPGDGPGEHAIEANNLRGTNLLRASTISGFDQPGSDGLRVNSNNANQTELRIDNSTFSNADGNDALAIVAQGISALNVIVENESLFTDLEGDAIDVIAGDLSGSTATVNLTVDDNDFTNAGTTGNGGIQARAAENGTLTGSITNNTFDDTHRLASNAGVVEIQGNDNGSVDLTVSGNDLDEFNQSGVNVVADDASDVTVVIDGNTMDTSYDDRIGVRASIRNTGATHLTIQNNQIGQTTAMPGLEGTRSPIDIEVFGDAGPADNARILIDNNTLRSNKSSAASEVVDVFVDDNADVNLIVTSNTLINIGSGEGAEIAADESTTAGTTLCLELDGNAASNPGPTLGDIELIESAGAYSVANLANVATNNPGADIVFVPDAGAFDSTVGCLAPLAAASSFDDIVVRTIKEPTLDGIVASQPEPAAYAHPATPTTRRAPFVVRPAFLTRNLTLPATAPPPATPGDTIALLPDPFTLPAGRSITVTVAVSSSTPLPAAVDSVQNQAIVTSNEFDDVLSVDPDPNPGFPAVSGETITPLTMTADLQIEKDDGRTTAAPGETITYTVVARNDGPDGAANATVQDVFPTALNAVTWSCTAAPGASCTASGSGAIDDTVDLSAGTSVTYTAVAQIDLDAAGLLVNTATITGTDAIVDSLPANNSSSDSTALSPLVDVALSLSESTDPVIAGSGAGNLTYVLTATNHGPSVASGLAVTDTLTLPPGVAVEGITPSAGTTWSGANSTWTIGDLAPGATETLTIVLTVGPAASPATDAIANRAAVSAVDQPDAQAANDSVFEATSIAPEPVEEDVDLRINKDDDADPVLAGEALTYTIVVTNAGPAGASGVSVSATLPVAFTYVSDNCGGAAGAGAWSWNVGALPAGQSRTCMLSGIVDVDAAGLISNSTSVTAAETDTDPSNNTATETTTVTPVDDEHFLYMPIIAKPLQNAPALAPSRPRALREP